MPALSLTPEVRRFLRSIDDAAAGPTVAEIYARYLKWARRHRTARTCEWSEKHLNNFEGTLPRDMQAADLRGHHVEEWLDAKTTWGANQRRGAIVAVTRPLNWAVKLGYLDANPVRGVEKPQPQRRESRLRPADFTALLAALPPGDPFRSLIVFAWETGCRPQEARQIEARHLRLEQHRVEIPRAEAKGKRRARIIYLSPAAEEILRELLARGIDGPLFRNARGRAWTADSIGCRFGRLKKQLGQRFACYDLRHAFATRKLKEGLDPITVAHLLGHKDAAMLCRHYEEIGGDCEHLAAAVGQRSEAAGERTE
jgi:integrase